MLEITSKKRDINDVRRGFMRDPAHFRVRFDVARQIIGILGSLGVDCVGKRLLDIGSGDGVIDLAMAHEAQSAISGIDIDKTCKDDLIAAARSAGYEKQAAAASLEFKQSSPSEIPYSSNRFDHIYSWSVFEHVWSPIPLLKEARRVLKSNGTLFIQIWPMWKSQYGAHLFDKFENWSHLVRSREEVIRKHEDVIGNPDLFHFATASYDSCTRIEIDELQRAILAAGFKVIWVEFITGAFSIPDNLQHLAWREMGLQGIKLVAVKNS